MVIEPQPDQRPGRSLIGAARDRQPVGADTRRTSNGGDDQFHAHFSCPPARIFRRNRRRLAQ